MPPPYTGSGLAADALGPASRATGGTPPRIYGPGSAVATPPAVTTVLTDPRDIPGLLAWYSAEAVTGLADGDPVTTWTDLSGNGNDATGVAGGTGAKPLYRATAGQTGRAAVEFTASGGSSGGTNAAITGGHFTLPASLMGSSTAGEIAITVKQGSNDYTGLWSINAVGAGFEGSHYPFAGTVYDDFGLNGAAQRQSFTPTLAINAWRRYNVYSAAGDWQAYLDGTSQATYAGGTVAWNAAPLLGATSHDITTVDMKFEGFMGAVVIYSRKLTTTERTNLDAWLAANPSGGIAVANAVANVSPSVTITASGTTGTTTTASVSETVSITATGVVGRSTSAAVSETVTITATGQAGTSTSATVSETVSITATGAAGPTGGASVTESAAITAAGITGTATTASVTETVSITAAGAVGLSTTASVTETVTITAAGSVAASGGVTGTAAVSETVSITAAGVVGTSGAASVAPVVTITAAGVVTKSTTAPTTTAVTITAAGTVGRSTSAAVAPSVVILASGVVGTSSSATVALTVTRTAAGVAGSPAQPTPASRTTIVAAENRTTVIAAENRVWVVITERRTTIVAAENRTTVIPFERRTVEVT